MNKRIWDLYAPIYEKAMRADSKIYGLMYERIPKVIQDKNVLEIATGPGLLAKHVAHAARTMVATDYSAGTISRIWSGILQIAGISFDHQWSTQEYLEFLQDNGWKITYHQDMPARITLAYVECVRDEHYK